ncbi:MAG: PH domain-containing protein [Phycisphaerae bacterium]|nr:PH domain-containing protein [Phycisphaerae bacterium]
MSNIPPGSFDTSAATAGVGDPHRPPDDTEQVYYDGSPMLRGRLGFLLGFTVLGIGLMIVPGLLSYYMKHGPPFLLIALLALLGLLLIFIPPLRARTVRYRITNYRVDFERGLLSRNIDTLELWHIEDIHFHQSLLDRILNVGTIVIIGHDETMPRLDMTGLPNPRPLYETLKQRVISVKRQRGVVKMDPG